MNPQENRAENRDEKNRDEKRKEKTDKPSRLGKEAKIGAAVILVLLAALGGVVVMRLARSDDKEKELASAADHDGGKHKSPLDRQDDPLFKGVDSRSFGSHQATVVTAKADLTRPPGSIDSGLDKWKLPSGKNESKRVESRYSAPSVPPSFAADPPKPPRANRYDSDPDDSLPGYDAHNANRFEKKQNESRLDLSGEKKRAGRADSGGLVSTREEFDRGESSGYAGASAEPPRPAYHEKPRYEDRSAALLPPSPPRDNSSYNGGAGRSYSATPVSQYDDDFSRASSRPHHYDAPSYGHQPAQRDDGKYEIQPNDSFWTISQKVYGTGAYFKALAEKNRGKIGNEDRLEPGELVATPSVAELEKAYPDLCPKASRRETMQSRTMAVSTRQSYRGGRSYTVAEGDTLFNIARYELGKASRWAEIYELNRDVLGKEFNYLTPGMQLVLPDNEKADVLTRRSGDLYR